MECERCSEFEGLKPSPAFSFYPADWLSDIHVRAMTATERGVYIDLIAHCWNEGSLPSNVQVLSRIVNLTGRLKRSLSVPLSRFSKCSCGAIYYQKRLDTEWRKQLERSEKARGAVAERERRKAVKRSSNDDRTIIIPSPSPSPSPNSYPKPSHTQPSVDPAREEPAEPFGAREWGMETRTAVEIDGQQFDSKLGFPPPPDPGEEILEQGRAKVRTEYERLWRSQNPKVSPRMAWGPKDDAALVDAIQTPDDIEAVSDAVRYAMTQHQPGFLWSDGRTPSLRRIAANLEQCVPPDPTLVSADAKGVDISDQFEAAGLDSTSDAVTWIYEAIHCPSPTDPPEVRKQDILNRLRFRSEQNGDELYPIALEFLEEAAGSTTYNSERLKKAIRSAYERAARRIIAKGPRRTTKAGAA